MLESLDKNQKTLIGLLSAGIRNRPYLTEDAVDIDWRALVEIAAVHDVSTLVYRPLKAGNGVTGVPEDLLEKLRIDSISVGMKQERDYLVLGDILSRFNASGIPVIPIKGLVFRELYPDPCLRTMGDYDLLVKPCDMARAGDILSEAGYTASLDSDKHITYTHSFLPDIELHESLASAGQFTNYEKFESNAWGRAVPAVVSGVRVLSLSPVDTAVHQVLHMAAHMIGSGFGLRQLCDFVLFYEADRNRVDWTEFFNITAELGIAVFASALFQLCCLLFGLTRPDECRQFEEPDDRLVEEMLHDIMDGGIFGRTTTERVTANRLVYYSGYLGLLLPGADKLDARFGYARKHRVLLPVAWIHRLIYCIVRRDIGLGEKAAAFTSFRPARLYNYRKKLLHELRLLD